MSSAAVNFRRPLANLRLVLGGAPDNATTSAECRKQARPILRQWLRRIELDVMAGQLAPLDVLTAKELCNYPSANHGRCFAGQDRLAGAIGSCARTVRSSLKRLCDRGFLSSKRGGPGKTSTWFFCVNGKLIFGGSAFLPNRGIVPASMSQPAQERQDVAGLERQDVADKPFEQTKPIEHYPPLSPTTEEPSPVAVQGEILNGTMTFQEFWLASGRRGNEGFARSEWRKLTVHDAAAVADHFRSATRRKRSGLWSGTWLRDRIWTEQEPLIVEPMPEVGPRFVYAEPGSALWRTERERKRLANESSAVEFMDDLAAAGKGITVRIDDARQADD